MATAIGVGMDLGLERGEWKISHHLITIKGLRVILSRGVFSLCHLVFGIWYMGVFISLVNDNNGYVMVFICRV